MGRALIILSAMGFAIAIFPVHLYSYIFFSTESRRMEVRVSLFKFIPLIRLSLNKALQRTEENNKNNVPKKLPKPDTILNMYNKLCITKIVQLIDIGIQDEKNAYFALAQNAATEFLYAFVRINEGRIKLRNYPVLNGEHGYINYYVKLVGVINFIALSRITAIYLWSKIYERKN